MAEKKTKTPEELLAEKRKEQKIVSNRVVSTGSPILDLNINPRMPGLPCGKVVTICGRPQSGKTSLGYSIGRALLAKNKPGEKQRKFIFIDVENGTNPEQGALFDNYGDDPNYEYILTNDGPFVLNYIESQIIANKGEQTELVIFVDGITHLSYNEEGELTDYAGTAAVAQGPNKLKVFFRENKGRLAETNICLIFTTYLTANINKKNKYDKDFILSGGSFLEYSSDIIMELTKVGSARDTEDKIDIGALTADKANENLGRFRDVRITFQKNKFSQDKILNMILCTSKEEDYSPGFLDLAWMTEYALKNRTVECSGNWISCNGGRWNGRSKFKKALRQSVEIAQGTFSGVPEPGVDGLFGVVYNQIHSRVLEEHRIKKP